VKENLWSRAKRYLAPLKFAVTVALIIYLVTLLEPARMIEAWKDFRTGWFLLAVVAVIPNVGAQLGRWRVGVRRAHNTASMGDTLRSLMAGFAMGAVTPGRLGEMAQVMFLPPHGGRKRALGVLAVLRVYMFAAALTLGLVMWALKPELMGIDPRLGRTAAIGGLCLMVLVAIAGELLSRESLHRRISGMLSRFSHAQETLSGVLVLRPTDRLQFAAWSWLCSAIYLTQLVWLMRAFGGSVVWFDGFAAGAMTIAVVALLPIALGNIGVREIAAIEIWQHLGISAPVAVNATLTMFMINVVLPGVIGMIWNARHQYDDLQNTVVKREDGEQ
jgi:uncharacterized membrane protein YbhN (UPF0104 family)